MTGTEVLAAFLAGSALSVSGAVLQSILRNPLAEPYMLGTVGGGALAAAAAMMLGATAGWMMQGACVAGALAALGVVFAVGAAAKRARDRNGADARMRSSGSTIVLAGFVTGSMAGSLEMAIIGNAEAERFKEFSKWLYGSVSGATAGTLAVWFGICAIAGAGMMMLAKELDVMELGHDEAQLLGVDVERVKWLAIAGVAVMTAVSVAAAGAIGFVGLVVPHAVRRICGARMRKVLPISAVGGGVVLVLAQVAGAVLPWEVPVGVVCAIAGAPCFLYLLARRRNGEGWDV